MQFCQTQGEQRFQTSVQIKPDLYAKSRKFEWVEYAVSSDQIR